MSSKVIGRVNQAEPNKKWAGEPMAKNLNLNRRFTPSLKLSELKVLAI